MISGSGDGWMQGSNTGLGPIFVAAVCWNIWKERNNRIFIGIAHTIRFCSSTITNDVRMWTKDLPGDGLQ